MRLGKCCADYLCVYRTTIKPLYEVVATLVYEKIIGVPHSVLRAAVRSVVTSMYGGGPIAKAMYRQTRDVLGERVTEEIVEAVSEAVAEVVRQQSRRAKYLCRCGWRYLSENELVIVSRNISLVSGYTGTNGYIVLCGYDECAPIRGIYPAHGLEAERDEKIVDELRAEYGGTSIYEVLESLGKMFAVKLEGYGRTVRTLLFVLVEDVDRAYSAVQGFRRRFYEYVEKEVLSITRVAESIENYSEYPILSRYES